MVLTKLFPTQIRRLGKNVVTGNRKFNLKRVPTETGGSSIVRQNKNINSEAENYNRILENFDKRNRKIIEEKSKVFQNQKKKRPNFNLKNIPENKRLNPQNLEKGRRVQVFGKTDSQDANPRTWTVWQKGKARGQTSRLSLKNPEFQTNRSGEYSTKGFKVPRSQIKNPNNITNARELELATRNGKPERIKTPYAFVYGDYKANKIISDGSEARLNIIKRSNKDKPLLFSDNKNPTLKKGGLRKTDVGGLLMGKKDEFVSQPTKEFKNGKPTGRYKSPKRLVGRKEFDTLSGKEKRNVALASGAEFYPAGGETLKGGGLLYYRQNLNYLTNF